jgi:hypothetical protein
MGIVAWICLSLGLGVIGFGVVLYVLFGKYYDNNGGNHE